MWVKIFKKFYEDWEMKMKCLHMEARCVNPAQWLLPAALVRGIPK